MAGSRGGRGNAVIPGFSLHRPAAQPIARGHIPLYFGQDCPLSRYPGIPWYSRMTRPPAGEPRTTGTQWQGYRWVLNCVGIYQLPQVAGSTLCPEPPQRVPLGQGRSGPYRQHGDRCIQYINRQGGLHPRRILQNSPPPAREVLTNTDLDRFLNNIWEK